MGFLYISFALIMYFNAKKENFFSRIKRSYSAGWQNAKASTGSAADRKLGPAARLGLKTENWLKRNGLDISASGLYITVIICHSVILVPCLFIKSGIFISVAISAVSLILFYILTDFNGRKINSKKEAQFETFLIDLSGYLYTNPNILAGIQKCAEGMEEPLRNDIETVIKDTKKGLRLNEALQRMIDRNRSKIMQIIITGLIAANEKGADSVTFLKDQVDYLREKKSIESYIRILSSGPRYTSYIIAIIPFVAVFAASFINKDFAPSLFNGIGLYVLIYACTSYLAGFLLINRIVNFSDKTDRTIK
jgi:Flp pilus assembly protein TadB